MERRGWVTHVEIGLVNWQQEEPTGIDRKVARAGYAERLTSGSVRGSG